MSTAPNPMAQMIMQAMMRQQQGGGAPPGMPGMPGAPGGGQPQSPGDAYSQQVSELKGADPGGLLRQLKAIKQICAIMLVQNLERLPQLNKPLTKMLNDCGDAIKAAEEASKVNQAVRPIGMGAAQPPIPEQANSGSLGNTLGGPGGGGF